jgi:hypothetical protein
MDVEFNTENLRSDEYTLFQKHAIHAYGKAISAYDAREDAPTEKQVRSYHWNLQQIVATPLALGRQ